MTQRSNENALEKSRQGTSENLWTPSERSDSFGVAADFFGKHIEAAAESGLDRAVDRAVDLLSDVFSVEVTPIQRLGITVALQKAYYTPEKVKEAALCLLGDAEFHERLRYVKTITAVDLTKAYDKKHSGRPVNLEKDW